MTKAQRAQDVKKLEDIPNIGPSLAEDLRMIGIRRPEDLKGKDGISLYQKLNQMTGSRHDPCVADTFLAAVDFMNGGMARPWWTFTAERKALFERNHDQ